MSMLGLGRLGGLKEDLVGNLTASVVSGRLSKTAPAYKSMVTAAEQLETADHLARSGGELEAKSHLARAQQEFLAVKQACQGGSPPRYCGSVGIDAYFRKFPPIAYRVGKLIEEAEELGPPPDIYGPEKIEPMDPAEHAMVQQYLQESQAKTISAPSSHVQAARIRAQQAAARAARSRAGATPRPMTSPQQTRIILAAQAKNTGKLGTGSTVALVGLGAVALLSLGVLLFGRK